MEVFINESIHNGLLQYSKHIGKQSLHQVHIFEFWVTRVLVNIYGEENILGTFKAENDKKFKKNLTIYGLKQTEVTQFINLMEEYDNWLNSPYLVSKTDLPTKIEAILIKMVSLKAKKEKTSKEELDEYYVFFDPIKGDLAKYKDFVVADKTITPSLWREERAALEGKKKTKVTSELLPASDYKRFGLDIGEVKYLEKDKIEEINTRILEEQSSDDEKAVFDPKKLILTSGSGFVDTLVLLSIIATQIFIALLIAFTLVRG